VPVLVARRRKVEKSGEDGGRPDRISEATENLFRSRAEARAAASGR
jgi:hypothetical protein